uniref:Uncharacterized protein n=1 Tax=Chromera velia CCMP2878 TaxID=1169474 RepID=A0A0G4HRL9_9ALVE|eukprot:Cvel_8095.t1-p1 / transcript=Cvel_8095.t1 / gene=Cvel_8095 / organism=Chromera_velia_CCMP2878 / gene_product=hypothetical protein / transcript_product=hypothetical protein / location=Cvel_scaffold440:764-1882(-) / protein_length=218 / sequence_SO=supercontig / SO=protein_coding / is_pseudo=false
MTLCLLPAVDARGRPIVCGGLRYHCRDRHKERERVIIYPQGFAGGRRKLWKGKLPKGLEMKTVLVKYKVTRYFTPEALEIMRKIPRTDPKQEIVIKKEEDLPEVKQEKGVARLPSASAAAAAAAAKPSPIVEEPLDNDDEEVPHFEMHVDVLLEANEATETGVQHPPAVVEENTDEDVMKELFQDRHLDREEAMSALSSENSNDSENDEDQEGIKGID